MVDRCLCCDVTFCELKSVIDKHGLKNFDELKKHITFGDNCGICIPYVRMIFRTGKTSFDVLNFGRSNE
jgi:bacterioferritin-associated ferredoxin